MSDAQIVLAFVLDGQTSNLDDKKAALARQGVPRRGGRDRCRHGQVPRPRRQVGLTRYSLRVSVRLLPCSQHRCIPREVTNRGGGLASRSQPMSAHAVVCG